MNVRLQQTKAEPKKLNIDSCSNWIFIFNQRISPVNPYHRVLSARKKAGKNKQKDMVMACDLPNQRGSHVTFVCINKIISSFSLLTLARKLVAGHNSFAVKEIAVFADGFDAARTEKITEALIAAILHKHADMPHFKSEPPSSAKLAKIKIYGIKTSRKFGKTFAEAEGNILARSLSMLPGNKLTPAVYLKKIKKLAKENKWQLNFYDIDRLKKLGAGAFLAVSQGSPTAGSGIVKLVYRPAINRYKKKLALVGKGICYDTGGINLKPANYMFGMHEDMQGSAVALGTLLALSRLQAGFTVECWLALAANHVSPGAYKPNDVVTASDGTSIEVVHTDAEGRMVLADTLALASKSKPELIIDYATLTGACVYSLGSAYSGVFTNKETLIPALVDTGKISGERVWPFPIDEDFDRLLESDIADIKQCSLKSGVDHILAARFLRRFIKNDVPWVHMDLSSSHHEGGLAHIPTDTTGFGVRFSLAFLLDQRAAPNF